MRNYNMIKGCMYVRSCTGRVSDMRTGQMSLNTNCSNIHTSRSIRTHACDSPNEYLEICCSLQVKATAGFKPTHVNAYT